MLAWYISEYVGTHSHQTDYLAPLRTRQLFPVQRTTQWMPSWCFFFSLYFTTGPANSRFSRFLLTSTDRDAVWTFCKEWTDFIRITFSLMKISFLDRSQCTENLMKRRLRQCRPIGTCYLARPRWMKTMQAICQRNTICLGLNLDENFLPSVVKMGIDCVYLLTEEVYFIEESIHVSDDCSCPVREGTEKHASFENIFFRWFPSKLVLVLSVSSQLCTVSKQPRTLESDGHFCCGVLLAFSSKQASIPSVPVCHPFDWASLSVFQPRSYSQPVSLPCPWMLSESRCFPATKTLRIFLGKGHRGKGWEQSDKVSSLIACRVSDKHTTRTRHGSDRWLFAILSCFARNDECSEVHIREVKFGHLFVDATCSKNNNLCRSHASRLTALPSWLLLKRREVHGIRADRVFWLETLWLLGCAFFHPCLSSPFANQVTSQDVTHPQGNVTPLMCQPPMICHPPWMSPPSDLSPPPVHANGGSKVHTLAFFDQMSSYISFPSLYIIFTPKTRLTSGWLFWTEAKANLFLCTFFQRK